MVWDNIAFNMERNAERRRMKARAAAAADAFIVHTERSRRVLNIEGVPDERIHLIDPGVDTALFSPGPRNRAETGLHEDDFVILFVGWLLPRKGIDFLLLALRELLRDPQLKCRRFRLLAVGSGPGRDRVDALVERLGLKDHCTFAGSLSYDHMPGVFRNADLFVLPSIAMPEWQEQFGMSLIEAMACGLPVVTTYSGSIPEIAADSAVLCQPNDFVSLFESIKSLALDDSTRKALGERARKRAVACYGLDRYATALSELYARLATG
jgi:glycosyltransferase involved in cell wall biosynthesis